MNGKNGTFSDDPFDAANGMSVKNSISSNNQGGQITTQTSGQVSGGNVTNFDRNETFVSPSGGGRANATAGKVHFYFLGGDGIGGGQNLGKGKELI
jgi:hypothetical protein